MTSLSFEGGVIANVKMAALAIKAMGRKDGGD